MTQLVAVYGSLREGFGNHYLLEDSVFCSREQIEPKYTMVDLGAFPGVLLTGNTPITVEVYEVTGYTFGRLDSLEGYPDFYNRKKVNTSVGEAWMYYLDENEWDSRYTVPSGDWAERDDDIPF